MNAVGLNLPEDEARALYRHLHLLAGAEDQYCETYRQLQAHFFRTMTVEQVTQLLDSDE